LKKHLFNNILWPDFSKFSNEHSEILAMEALPPGRTVIAGGLEVTPFLMKHSVECYGYLVQAQDAAIALCGDTDSTEGLAEVLEGADNLKAVILEAAFPAKESKTAGLSRHLSTVSFAREAASIPRDVKILVTHLKPEFETEIRNEIDALRSSSGNGNISLIEQDREYTF